MCGRYNIDFEANKELKKILRQLNKKYPENCLKKGEVFPTNEAAILIEEESEVTPELSVWGYPQYTGKGVIINARSETAMEKKTFRESLLSRRCIIPTNGFYEWDKEKHKFLFERLDAKILYLAGLYNVYEGQKRFVILTTAANESMKMVHHRMPIVLEEEEAEPWLFSTEAANLILHVTPKALKKVQTN